MTDTTYGDGRLCNHIIRNIAVHFIAKKHDLNVKYGYYEAIYQLGIPLFSGNKQHKTQYLLSDNNYKQILEQEVFEQNLNANSNYFQTIEIMNMIYQYLRVNSVVTNIIEKNPFRERFCMNNDMFIHIRLSDVSHLNPGLNYYLHAIRSIPHDKLFIATDSNKHNTVLSIKRFYCDCEIVNFDEIKTIQFGSTCKHVVLSHGSFSAIIGYLAYKSDVYFPEFTSKIRKWHGDMFSVEGWSSLPI